MFSLRFRKKKENKISTGKVQFLLVFYDKIIRHINSWNIHIQARQLLFVPIDTALVKALTSIPSHTISRIATK